jgi:hypothetical protein
MLHPTLHLTLHLTTKTLTSRSAWILTHRIRHRASAKPTPQSTIQRRRALQSLQTLPRRSPNRGPRSIDRPTSAPVRFSARLPEKRGRTHTIDDLQPSVHTICTVDPVDANPCPTNVEDALSRWDHARWRLASPLSRHNALNVLLT